MSDSLWGPYWETYDPNTDQYLLFKLPNPDPIAKSKVPLLKKHVSILLNELLKPHSITGTAVPGFDRGSNEVIRDWVIKAAIAAIDEEVLRKVDATSSDEEALAVLALMEDPRFGDLAEPGCEPLRDKLFSYIRRHICSRATDSAEHKKSTEDPKVLKARTELLGAELKKRGWTANRLAELTGMKHTTIKKILSGKNNVYPNSLEKLRGVQIGGEYPLKDLP